MGNAAKVLVVGDESSSNKKLSFALREKGYDSVDSDFDLEKIIAADGGRPDVVILSMLAQSAKQDPAQYLEFVKAIKLNERTGRMPVILLGERDGLAGQQSDAMRAARVDEIMYAPVSAAQVCGRINSLVRLNTMHEELVRRLNTSAKYGIDAPANVSPPRTVTDASVLVVGATLDFPFIEEALAKEATLVGALTTTTALDYMMRRDFDAIVVDLNGDPGPVLELARNARMNSQLYNTPFIMLAAADDIGDVALAFESGYTDVLGKPIDQEELRGRVMSLVRELRFRDSLRHVYSQARHMATSDGLTGLYSKGFLLEHLRAMLDDSNRWNEAMSLSFFEVINMAAINEEYGYVIGDRIIRQVGEMMGMLVRGEDLTARYSGARFVVVLPDTAPEFADIAVRRIIGVVNFTEFSVAGINEPIHVELVKGVTGRSSNDTPESIIARARELSAKPATI